MIRPKELILEDILVALGGTPSTGSSPRGKDVILADVLARMPPDTTAAGVKLARRTASASGPIQLHPTDPSNQWVTLDANERYLTLPPASGAPWTFIVHHAGGVAGSVLYVLEGATLLTYLMPGHTIMVTSDGETITHLPYSKP